MVGGRLTATLKTASEHLRRLVIAGLIVKRGKRGVKGEAEEEKPQHVAVGTAREWRDRGVPPWLDARIHPKGPDAGRRMVQRCPEDSP